MFVSAIVVAAGKGVRLRSRVSKPLVRVCSMPVVIYCLTALSSHPLVKAIVVVANGANIREIKKAVTQYKVAKVTDVVLGGPQRNDSVYNGLKAIDPKTDLVLVHDGVRPFIDKKIVSAVIKQARSCGAAIVGVPVKATIKQVDGSIVEKTIDRRKLWEIQTPQVFKKELLVEAYGKFGNEVVTDDSMLVEKLGVKVRVVLGAYKNIKITTPEDLIVAEAIAKNG
jgi:2-C-methyl-D-erythritol 4-phosphate cytidylyltransferase